MLTAELEGNNNIVFEGVRYTHRTPIFHLARQLLEDYENESLTVTREGIEVFCEPISKLAKLTIQNEPTEHFAKYFPFSPDLKLGAD
mgnify:CR=1 FL=1